MRRLARCKVWLTLCRKMIHARYRARTFLLFFPISRFAREKLTLYLCERWFDNKADVYSIAWRSFPRLVTRCSRGYRSNPFFRIPCETNWLEGSNFISQPIDKHLRRSKRERMLESLLPIPPILNLDDFLDLPPPRHDSPPIPKFLSLCLGVRTWCFFLTFPKGLWLILAFSSLSSVSRRLYFEKLTV